MADLGEIFKQQLAGAAFDLVWPETDMLGVSTLTIDPFRADRIKRVKDITNR